jgi:hypothetical protein
VVKVTFRLLFFQYLRFGFSYSGSSERTQGLSLARLAAESKGALADCTTVSLPVTAVVLAGSAAFFFLLFGRKKEHVNY